MEERKCVQHAQFHLTLVESDQSTQSLHLSAKNSYLLPSKPNTSTVEKLNMYEDDRTARIRPLLAPGYVPPPIALEREVARDPCEQRKVKFIETAKPEVFETVLLDPQTISRPMAKPKTVEPPKYDGSVPAEDWLDKVIISADTNGWPVDDQLVKRVATYLVGKAYDAYKLLAYSSKIDTTNDSTPDPNTTFRLLDGYANNIGWDKFVDHMKNVFPQKVSRVDSKIILDERKQRKGENFSSYAVDKLTLCRLHDDSMNKQTKVLHLIAGALPKVQEKLEDKEQEILTAPEPLDYCIKLGHKYTRTTGDRSDILEETRNLHDGLLAAVTKVEETAKRLLEKDSQNSNQSSSMKVTNGYKQQQPRNNNRQRNNIQQQPRGRIINGRFVPNTFSCYYCGKPGHYKRDCYSRLRDEAEQGPNMNQQNNQQPGQNQLANDARKINPTAPLQPNQGNTY